MKHKLLVVWPGYDPGKEAVFKVIFENFESKIAFVGTKLKEFTTTKMNMGSLAPYANDGRLLFLNYKGVRVLDHSPQSLLRLAKDLYLLLKQEPWHFVLFSTNNPVSTKIGFVLCRVLGIRLGVKVEDWFHEYFDNPLLRFYHYIGKIVLRYADYCFPHGRGSEQYCFTLRKELSHVLIFPLAIPGYNVNPAEYQDKITKLVYCGRLTKEKNVLLLLRAFRVVQNEYANVVLVIAGGGPLKSQMKQYVTENDLQHKVSFRGAYARHELPDILTTDSALILPSKKEGWGMVVNEAASLGRPVIVSDAAGVIYDLVDEGKNGFVFRSNDVDSLVDAIRRLLDASPEHIIAMQTHSRMLFDRYNDFSEVTSVLETALNC